MTRLSMDSTTLIDLAHHFDTKLSNLQTSYDLTEAKHDPSCQKLLVSLGKELEGLECILSQMKAELQKGKEAVSKAQEIKVTYQDVIEALKYTIRHLPARLPNKPVPGQHIDLHCKPDKNGTTSSIKHKAVEVSRPMKEVVYCPPIEYLTVDEFDTVPKYMKGRLTYNQLNSVIDDLNKTFQAKYKILKMKRTKLSDVNRKRYETFKLQESKDCKDTFFVVEGDMKEFAKMKMDAISRSMLTVLRHCGRIREIRGGGITRFAIVEMY
ncbi:spindle and kinetochore-associated protein 1-like [Haliotis asinina]|uniref:spindle and kinetochore-associated protein 1-like n=1 Tax=Haliotis asinina TaxID=109174 RepID=UPI0035324C93